MDVVWHLLEIMFETHNKVALEFMFAFSIVKY